MADIFLRLLKLLTKWKPEWLYEVMPFIYMLAGFVVIYHFDTAIGYGAGALLIIAAFLIWALRFDHRAKNASSLEDTQIPRWPDR